MNIDLTLTVALRGADPVALTAHHALTHRLGFDGVLLELGRYRVWRFEVSAAGVADALVLAGSWITRSNLFVNPNKHVYELGAAVGGEGGRGGPRGSSRVAWVVVSREPDLEGQAAVRLIGARFGGRELALARQVLVWRLRFAPGVDPAEVPRLAGEIAVARARTRGLLSNPHFETAAVVRAASPAAAVEAAVAAELAPGGR
jgi:hypothetical protein